MWRHQEKTAKNRSPQGSSSIKALPLEAQAHKQKDKRYIPGLGGNKPCLSQPVCSLLFQQPKQTKSHHQTCMTVVLLGIHPILRPDKLNCPGQPCNSFFSWHKQRLRGPGPAPCYLHSEQRWGRSLVASPPKGSTPLSLSLCQVDISQKVVVKGVLPALAQTSSGFSCYWIRALTQHEMTELFPAED